MPRVSRFALLAVAAFGGFPALVDSATAAEGEMARRGIDPESYIVSSSDVISPEAGRDYFARDAWVSSGSTVTVARAGGGAFWVRVYEPDGVGGPWLQVEDSFSWQATPEGQWRVHFGQVNYSLFVDFGALVTDPPSALLRAVREEIAAGEMAGPLPRSSAQVLVALLRRSERALDAGHAAIACRSLERFTRMVADLVDRGEVRWATGQLWLNVAEYVTDDVAPQSAHAPAAATQPTTWGGIKGLYR